MWHFDLIIGPGSFILVDICGLAGGGKTFTLGLSGAGDDDLLRIPAGPCEEGASNRSYMNRYVLASLGAGEWPTITFARLGSVRPRR